MSSHYSFNQSPRTQPTLPQGDVVATFDTYLKAQQSVDVLARANFPLERVSIIGSDLKSVERVTGRLTWGRVAVAGAASGVWLGIFFGLLMTIFSSTLNIAVVLAAVLIGAGFGMLFGLVSYAINRRSRDFTSTMQVIASSYSVLVSPELVNRARNLLRGADDSGADEAPRPHPSDPPLAAPSSPDSETTGPEGEPPA